MLKKAFDLPKYQFEYIQDAHYYRGILINEFTGLEKTIENYLIAYFLGNSDKGHELSNIILDRLTFEAKRQSFKTIIDKKSIENGFVKTNNNSYPHSKFFDEIRRLNDERVCFAHYLVVMPDEATENVIGLVEFRDSVKVKWYSKVKFETILKNIAKTTKKVEEFISEITP